MSEVNYPVHAIITSTLSLGSCKRFRITYRLLAIYTVWTLSQFEKHWKPLSSVCKMPFAVFAALRTVDHRKVAEYWWNNWACPSGHFVYTHSLNVSPCALIDFSLLKSQASFSFVRTRITILSQLPIPFRIFLCYNLFFSADDLILSHVHECHIFIGWYSHFWVILWCLYKKKVFSLLWA